MNSKTDLHVLRLAGTVNQHHILDYYVPAQGIGDEISLAISCVGNTQQKYRKADETNFLVYL